MKKLTVILVLFLMVFSACGPRPQYKTRSGKKKNTHYNSIQYDKKKWNRQN